MLQESLRLGYLLSEKCELQKAEEAFQRALTLAREQNDQRVMMEVISALLRLAGEALDGRAIQKWDEELDRLIASFP